MPASNALVRSQAVTPGSGRASLKATHAHQLIHQSKYQPSQEVISFCCAADEKLAAAHSHSRDDAALIAQLKMQCSAAEQDIQKLHGVKGKLEQQLHLAQTDLAVMNKNMTMLKVACAWH